MINSILKPAVIEEIGLLMEEIKSSEIHIAEQAIEHIYAKETILTFGLSRTVMEFFKEAAKFRKFEVVVAESAPS
jgi:translation initiation factor eIF-2B subunit beta